MGAGHRENERVAVHGHNIPRTRQSLGLGRLVPLFVEALLAGANYSQHFLRGEVDFADGVVLGVAQVNEVLVLAEDVAEAVRVVELGLAVVAVDEPDLAVADLRLESHRFFVDHEHAVVRRVRHKYHVVV
mgnify:CR=1 FL=1